MPSHNAGRLRRARYASSQRSNIAALNTDLHAEILETEVRLLLTEGRVPTVVAIRALINLTAELETDLAEGIDVQGEADGKWRHSSKGPAVNDQSRLYS